MLSAVCFNLDQSKMLSSNGLNHDAAIHEGVVPCNNLDLKKRCLAGHVLRRLDQSNMRHHPFPYAREK